ncbi:hypothetical protein [Enterococcus sp. UD-01]|uniref:hypothetical protein n=1 Tax=Enterococcus sp. UD-01 TaxID=3373911 RepID=UPI003832BB15
MSKLKKIVLVSTGLFFGITILCIPTHHSISEAKTVIARNDTYNAWNNPWSSYTSFNYLYKNVASNKYLKSRSYGSLGNKWWNYKYVTHYRWWWNY